MWRACLATSIPGVMAQGGLTMHLGESVMAQQWSEYAHGFGKSYSQKEQQLRFDAFQANLKIINEHNEKHVTYSLGTNTLADLSHDEYSRTRLGYHSTSAENWGLTVLETHQYDGNRLADSIDWRDEGVVTPVKDQGTCGSCWAFSTTGALESAWAIGGANLTSLSEAQFINCNADGVNSGCNGGVPQVAMAYATTTDVCTGATYPYNGLNPDSGVCKTEYCTVGIPAGGILGVVNVEKSQTAFMSALTKGPVSVSVDASSQNFQLYDAGVFKASDCKTAINHAVLLVGYGTDGTNGDYWLIKNSWGAGWGEKGYIRLERGSSTGSDGPCGLYMAGAYPTVNDTDASENRTVPPAPWVVTLKPSRYVNVLSVLSFGNKFPQPGDPEQQTSNYLINVSSLPLVVLCLGLAAAVAAFSRMCCCAPKGAPRKRPTVRQTAFCTFLALALIITGFFLFYFTGYNAFLNVSDRLVKGVEVFDQAEVLGDQLQTSSEDVSASVQELKTQCPDFYNQYMKSLGDTLDASLGEVQNFTVQVKDVASNIDSVKASYDKFNPYFLIALSVPAALVAVLCLIMSISAFATRFACGLSSTKCMNCCCVRFTSVFVICTIIVVTATAVALFAFVIVSSNLCDDGVDGTLLNYMDAYIKSDYQSQLARYYILGLGSNPVQVQLESAMSGLSSVSRNVTTYSVILASACPQWNSTKLQVGLNQSSMVLDECEDLIAPEAIYPYYDDMVHQDVCGHIIAGSTVLVGLQALLGVLVLPAVAEASTTFLWRWKMWQEQERERQALLQNPGQLA